MKKFLVQYQETGQCVVDVDKVCKAWTDKFMVDCYDKKWSLIKYGRGQRYARVTISEDQALEIIQKADLKKIRSTIFKVACTYKKASFIRKELDRLDPIRAEAVMKVDVIDRNIERLTEALYSLNR